MSGTAHEGLADRARLVHRLAGEQGFGLVGIAPAEPSDHGRHVRRWIDAGHHGQMRYLAEHLETRLDPRRLLPDARSIICVADFHPDHVDHAPLEQPSTAPNHATGRIARYAWGRDYHKLIKRRLHRLADALADRFPDHAFRCTVDTAPILEREHAARAGLGWIGKHTLLIHPRFGSWMLLGTIVTTLAIQTSADAGHPPPLLPPADHCGTCTRCIDACPTRCISPRQIDARRCISYLTIEHRDLIDPGLHEPMGEWIAGCDVCQEVCPYNQPASAPAAAATAHDAELLATPSHDDPARRAAPPLMHRDYTPRDIAAGLPLTEVLDWTEADRRRAFSGTALTRIKLDMIRRNALIAAGNAIRRRHDPELRQRVERIARTTGEPPLVRATAKQVLARLADATPPHEAAPATPPSA